MRLGQRSSLHEAGHAAAAGRIGLQDIDGLRLEHAAEIEGLVTVFTRGDVHSRGRPVAHQAQASEIVARHRLLEPGDAERRGLLRKAERLLALQRAVCIDIEFRIADGSAGCAHTVRVPLRLAADLHLDGRTAVLLDPAGELFGSRRSS